MKTTERTVHFYDLELQSRTRAKDIESPSSAKLGQLLEIAHRCVKLPLQTHTTGLSVNILNDWKFDENTDTHTLLFNRADAAVSDVSFRNIKSRALRKGNKAPEEGIEISTHVLVRPNTDGRTALALMTMGSGIPIRHIANALNKQWNDQANESANKALFNFSHPSNAVDANGKPQTYKVRYSLNCAGHAGVVLTEALKNGKFMELELIRRENTEFDQGGNLRIKSESLRVGVGSDVSVSAAMLKRAIRLFVKDKPKNERYKEARIRYRRPSGGEQTVSLALDNLDEAFTRKEKIKFDTDVDAQQTKLSPTIVAELKKLI